MKVKFKCEYCGSTYDTPLDRGECEVNCSQTMENDENFAPKNCTQGDIRRLLNQTIAKVNRIEKSIEVIECSLEEEE